MTYVLLKGSCSILFTGDHRYRWRSALGRDGGRKVFHLAFFENSIYIADGSLVYRNDLDGTVDAPRQFRQPRGEGFPPQRRPREDTACSSKLDTKQYLESIIMEIDTAGKLLKTWNMADIISAAMTAGGDDPAEFVFPGPGRLVPS